MGKLLFSCIFFGTAWAAQAAPAEWSKPNTLQIGPGIYREKVCDKENGPRGHSPCGLDAGFDYLPNSNPAHERRLVECTNDATLVSECARCPAGFVLFQARCQRPIDGGWSRISTLTIGNGSYSERVCNNPLPDRGGAPCTANAGYQLVSGSSPLREHSLQSCNNGTTLVSSCTECPIKQNLVDGKCVVTPPVKKVTVAYATLKGVDPNLLSLDIYPVVSIVKAPVLIYVHGGGWSRGDKAHQLQDKIDHYNKGKGYVLVSVNYRLSPEVVHPAHLQDVAKAIAWVKSHIVGYGGDPQRLALMGHSAGAHLVSLVSTHPTALSFQGLALRDLRCVVSIDSAAYDINDQLASPSSHRQDKLYRQAFGNSPTTWTDASPTHWALAGGSFPNYLILKRGAPDRMVEAERFATALRAAGSKATTLEASRYSHEGINNAIGNPADRLVTPTVDAFLQSCY